MITRRCVSRLALERIVVKHDKRANLFTAEMPSSSKSSTSDRQPDVAYVSYEIDGKTIDFQHTEVPDVFRGKGVGALLAKSAFEFADAEKLTVKLSCDYLKHIYSSSDGGFPKLNLSDR